MPSARVVVHDDFKKLGQQYERGIKRALGHTASVVASAASSAPSPYKIGGIENSVKVTPVHRVKSGWRLLVWAADWRAGFFEFGTYKHRRKALKRPRKPAGQHRMELGNKGVTAQHFMSRAAKVGRPVLLEAVKRELGRK